MFSPLKISVIGLAVSVWVAPAALAQGGPSAAAGSPASLDVIPRSEVRIGTPSAPPGPGVPWISERRAASQPSGGPLLPTLVRPAVDRLDADSPPAPPADVVVLPVTTILIVLLVVVIVLAVD